MVLTGEPAAGGPARGALLSLAVAAGGVALAWSDGRQETARSRFVATREPAAVVRQLERQDPRWVWWTARETAAPLLAAGVRLRRCWDLGAVGRLVHGLRRDDPAAVWAAGLGLPEPPVPRGDPGLFDGYDDEGSVRGDGQLSREWARGGWAHQAADAERWAVLALAARARQEDVLRALPDPRPAPGEPPLALLTAYAESAAALLAVELEHDGLPLDRAVAGELLRALIGPPPADEERAVHARRRRDEQVLRHFPGDPVDLRNPLQVRELLARVGVAVPDTRSWRLEPHAATSAAVAALLAWRKAERTATTYGWGWLDRHVGADGRLRGAWGAADAAAGRMTAQAGLHNLPAELRPAVRAEPGYLLVRSDLGQVEPRVLAAVSGDRGLARAAAEDDMYAPVAAQLGCDRPRAKVAVLAAMYGQTSGPAGAALRDLDRAYPTAMAYLRAAEEHGRRGQDLRTYGGRLLRLAPPSAPAPSTDEHVAVPAGSGRFARNAVVQGAAAELFKAWAATVRGALPALGGSVVLCLHDELLLHVPREAAPAAVALLGDALAATSRRWAAGSGVRFVAETAVGDSWAGAH